MKSYLAVGAVAALSTWLLTFPVRRIGRRLNWVERAADRSMHPNAMLTTGGLGMYLAFLIAMGVASLLPSFRPIFEASSEPFGVVLAATVIYIVGFVDDLLVMSPPAKMAGIVLAGTSLYFLGVTMYYFRIPFAGVIVLSPDVIPLATVIWVAGMANATNFIDGLDGLASGIVAIAAGSFFLYSTQLTEVGLVTPDNVGPLIAIITMGVCLGFLPHNFHPAKIIMGDGGALFLGLLMAASTLVVGGRTDDPFGGQTYFFYAPIVIPIVIMGVPIFDTAFAIVRRAARRGDATHYDKGHLHHRLFQLGHGQRRSVVILWAWSALLSAVVLIPSFTATGSGGRLFVPVGAMALAIALYTYFHPQARAGGEPGAVQLRLLGEDRVDPDTGKASTR